MEIRVLRYFVAIAQAKSISRAADILHVTQPTLSRQIKELEEELGTRLCHRSSRGLQLTEEGQFLYNRAIDILALVDKTEEQLRRPEEISGELQLGAAESQSLDQLARVIRQLTETYPKTRVHVQSGNADNILEHLNHGVYDFAIIFGDVDQHVYDSVSLPTKDQWGFLVPSDHPLASLDRVSLKEVEAYPLILSAQSSPNFSHLTRLSSYRVVGTYNLLYNASLMVKAGVGIALCLDGIVQTDEKENGLTFVPLIDQKVERLQLIWKRGNTLPPIAKVFLTLLREDLMDDLK